MMRRLWRWIKEHVVWLAPEKDGRTDSKGGGVGIRFKF